MSRKVYFDLDGTLYDLYGTPNWLEDLRTEKEGVFLKGKNLFSKEELYSQIAKLTNYGYTFGIISWLPMQATPEYEEICRMEKLKWIQDNIPFISEINIAPYGILKQNCIQKKAKEMYLIDDNAEVCKAWATAVQRKSIIVSSTFTVKNALDILIEKIKGD